MSWRNRVHSKWRTISVIGNASEIVEVYRVDETGRLFKRPRRQKRRILHSKCSISPHRRASDEDSHKKSSQQIVDASSSDLDVSTFVDDINDVFFSSPCDIENTFSESSDNFSFFDEENFNNDLLYSLD